MKTFYVETPCLTYGAAEGSASTPKLAGFDAETFEEATKKSEEFWGQMYRITGPSTDVTERVLATRKPMSRR